MPLLLLLIFIVLPIAELYVIIQVGGAIGVVPTLAILLLDGVIGAALARSQGRAAWQRFNEATAAGKVPAKEVFDGVCIIVGGAFLLAPGFITDAIGISLLAPPSRALYRRLLMSGARRVGPTRPVMFFYDRRGSVPGGGRGPARDRRRLPPPGRAGATTSRAAPARSPTSPTELERGRDDA